MYNSPIAEQHERKTLITPLLRSLARITPLTILKYLISLAIAVAVAAIAAWYAVMLDRERRGNVEREGNEDADEALKELDGDGKKKGKKNEGKKDEKEEGKGEKEGK